MKGTSLSVRLSVGSLLVLVVLAAVGALVTPMGSTTSACCAGPPSRAHWLGTATNGADLLATVLRGLSTSAAIAVAATLLAVVFGVLWGALAASLPRRGELTLMRAVDVLAAAPFTLFVVTAVVVLRAARPALPSELAELLDARLLLVFSVAAIEWLALARVAHARIASLRHRPFVETARVVGVPPWRVWAIHIAPHTLASLRAYAVLALPSALAAESFFSFLGFGVEAPHTSLGALVAEGAQAMSVAPLTLLVPAGALVAATVALHVLGAHLRDAFRADG